MSTPAQVLQAQAAKFALEKMFGVSPKIANDNVGPTVYYDGAELKEVQAKIKSMMSKKPDPSSVRVEWASMIAPAAISSAMPILGAVGLLLFAMQKK
jgi:hypothetical protein